MQVFDVGSQKISFTAFGNTAETNLRPLSEYKAHYSHLHGIFDLHNLIKSTQYIAALNSFHSICSIALEFFKLVFSTTFIVQ